MTTDALLLVAHGSRDPRAEQAIDRLAGRVAAARPGLPVAVATLELRGRRVAEVVPDLVARGVDRVVVVPLLLTNAYHGAVDLPAVLDRARRDLGVGVEVVAGRVLGPDDLLLDALDEQASRTGFDGIVLAVAGTRDRAARAEIDRVAARFGRRHAVPCLAAHASGGGPDIVSTTRRLRGFGRGSRILVASYFLAPGLLHDRIVAGARQAGAVAVTEPFAGTASVAALTLRRYDRAALSVLAA